MSLISTIKAEALIASIDLRLEKEEINLLNSANRILAEDVFTDRPLPAFDQVRMDGIAIQYQAFQNGTTVFEIEGIQAAGAFQNKLNTGSGCYEVMTGAILPENTDTVIRYEDLEIEGGLAKILEPVIKKGQNIQTEGSYIHQNKLILEKGTRIGGPETGILASVGKSRVKVYALPKIGVISTGDELVDISHIPARHQIRRSNTYCLNYELNKLGISSKLMHIPDNQKELSDTIRQCLEKFNILIFSGAVSKGKFDYLPDVLSKLGVQCHFHGVKQRPGKPFWFGSSKHSVVFAFPGNPISGYMCFHKYFTPWLDKQINYRNPNRFYAELQEEVHFKPELDYFCQIKLSQKENGQYLAFPIQGKGSGDFITLSQADGFLQLPSSKSVFAKGELYPIYPFR